MIEVEYKRWCRADREHKWSLTHRSVFRAGETESIAQTGALGSKRYTKLNKDKTVRSVRFIGLETKEEYVFSTVERMDHDAD